MKFGYVREDVAIKLIEKALQTRSDSEVNAIQKTRRIIQGVMDVAADLSPGRPRTARATKPSARAIVSHISL
jgi:hypothetical protein